MVDRKKKKKKKKKKLEIMSVDNRHVAFPISDV